MLPYGYTGPCRVLRDCNEKHITKRWRQMHPRLEWKVSFCQEHVLLASGLHCDTRQKARFGFVWVCHWAEKFEGSFESNSSMLPLEPCWLCVSTFGDVWLWPLPLCWQLKSSASIAGACASECEWVDIVMFFFLQERRKEVVLVRRWC